MQSGKTSLMLLSDHFAHHDDDLQEFILLAAEQYDDKPHLFDMVGSCQFGQLKYWSQNVPDIFMDYHLSLFVCRVSFPHCLYAPRVPERS
jgi:hypothetical protein